MTPLAGNRSNLNPLPCVTAALTNLLLIMFQSHRKKLITKILLVGLTPSQPPCSAVPVTFIPTINLWTKTIDCQLDSFVLSTSTQLMSFIFAISGDWLKTSNQCSLVKIYRECRNRDLLQYIKIVSPLISSRQSGL